LRFADAHDDSKTIHVGIMDWLAGAFHLIADV